jgi:hypothetical protein
MNRYTIVYQYGTYTGTESVVAVSEEQAIAKMWKRLQRFTTLPMAYQYAKVTNVEPIKQNV